MELKTKAATRCIYSHAHTPEASKLRLISRELRNYYALDTVQAPERSPAQSRKFSQNASSSTYTTRLHRDPSGIFLSLIHI